MSSIWQTTCQVLHFAKTNFSIVFEPFLLFFRLEVSAMEVDEYVGHHGHLSLDLGHHGHLSLDLGHHGHLSLDLRDYKLCSGMCLANS